MLKNMWNEMNELFSPKERVLVLMVMMTVAGLTIWLYTTLAMLYIEKLF